RRPVMKYEDLRDFLAQLERAGALKRIALAVDPRLEMTEICDRTLRAGGPALLFERPKGHTLPVLGNLFGTPQPVALGMGQDSVEGLRDVGRLLAFLKEPEPPKGMRDAWDKLPLFKQALNLGPRMTGQAPWQRNVTEGEGGASPAQGAGGGGGPHRHFSDPDLLARRCRATDHVGSHRDARDPQGT